MKNRPKIWMVVAAVVLTSSLMVFLVLARRDSVEQRGQRSVKSMTASEGLSNEKGIVGGGETVAQALAVRLVRKGNEDDRAGRLRFALRSWDLAFFLDPSNAAAEAKLERGRKELEKAVDREFRQGNYAFKYLQYEKAVEHWDQACRLLEDPSHPKYQEAQKGMSLARAILKRSRG